MQTIYLLSVSSVHNEDDDSGSQYDGNPVSRVQLYADRDTALRAAENIVQATVAEASDTDAVGVERARVTDAHLLDVTVTDWCEHTFVTVDRMEVAQ